MADVENFVSMPIVVYVSLNRLVNKALIVYNYFDMFVWMLNNSKEQ